MSAIDVMPTLAHLLKLEPAHQWPGQLLTRLLDAADGNGAARPVFSQATQYQQYKPEPQQTVVSGHFKLIRGLESGRIQLYDLTGDSACGRHGASYSIFARRYFRPGLVSNWVWPESC